MRGRIGLFKRVVSLAITMSVLLSVGMTVHAGSSYCVGEIVGNKVYEVNAYDDYNHDFYYYLTPVYSGIYTFYISKTASDYSDGQVTIYTEMSGYGDGFSGEVACWNINTADRPGTRFQIILQRNTTYYFRFHKEGSNYPGYYFYMTPDESRPVWCNVTMYANNVQPGEEEATREFKLARGFSSVLDPNPFPAQEEGLAFAGWSTTRGGDLIYRDRELVSIGENQETLDLYAVWGERLSFNINGGTGDAIPDTGILPGEVVILPECSWTKNGAAFAGWSLNADGTGVRYYPGDIFDFTGPTTFYAQYEGQSSYDPLYQLSADANQMYLNIYVPYVDSYATTLYLDNRAQTPSQRAVVVGSKTYDVYLLSCPARCMADTHTIEIRYGDSVLFTGSISVRSYLRSIINSSSTTDNQKNAARAMLRYGAAAQLYFQYPEGVTEDDPRIANYGIEGAEISSLANMSVPYNYPAGEIISTFQSLRCSTYYGMNLTFTDEMTLMIAFRINDGCTFEQAKTELLGDLYFHEGADIQVDGSTHYCVVRYNVRLFNLVNSLCPIRSVNVQDYLNRVSGDENVDVTYRNLCLALWGYYNAANRLR